MKAVKIFAILLFVYIGIVITFESLLGYFQPQNESTLVITTFEQDGTSHDRVVARIETESGLYVAVNHWPRAWYYRLLENPEVEVTIGTERGRYVATAVTDEAEYDMADSARPLGPVFRILTGFPPRYFVRLDPAEA